MFPSPFNTDDFKQFSRTERLNLPTAAMPGRMGSICQASTRVMQSTRHLMTLVVLATPVFGGTFSGTLKTKQGIALASFPLQAVKDGNGEVVNFETSRSGGFSTELGEGSWTVTADETTRVPLGLAPLNTPAVSMSGTTPVVRDLVLFASLPLRTPTLKFSRSSTGGLSFKVTGQASTTVTIYSSTDLVNWSPYYSRSIVTGYSYTVGNPPGSFPRRYFKAVASE